MSATESVTPRLCAETLAASRGESRATSGRTFKCILAMIEMTIDCLTCALGIVAAYLLNPSLYLGGKIQFPLREATAVSFGFSLIVVLLMQRDRAYRGSIGLLQIWETERAIRIPVQALLVMLPFSLLLDLRFSGTALFIALFVTPVLLIFQKHAFVAIVRGLHAKRYSADRVVVYGIADTAKWILSALSHSTRMSLDPIAVVTHDDTFTAESMPEMGYRRHRSVPIQRGPITPALLKLCQCSILVMALPNLSSEQIETALDAAQQAGTRVVFLSATGLQEQKWTESIDVDCLSLTPVFESFERWPYSIVKRWVDLIGSSLLLVLCAPLLFLIAFLIKLDSAGPALFVQGRVGRHGKVFKMYKFRSMYKDTPQYELSPSTPSDPRITRIGRVLRKNSLDELPQLMNVLLGDMSLVGPRPEMPFIANGYIREQRQRIQVIPGITGLWQLSADRAFPIHENIQYDLYYIRNRGLFMDFAILVHTLLFAMRGGI